MLTVLGIVIGVAAVVTMVTVGNGVTVSVRSQISALGANSLIVIPNNSGRQAGSAAPRRFLAADVDAIREQVAGIDAVSGQVTTNAVVIANGINWDTSIIGTTGAGVSIQSLTISAGRGFSSDEESAGMRVCILGNTVISNLFGSANPLGHQLRIGDVSCVVIGILAERGRAAMGIDQDDVILMPLRAVQRQILGDEAIAMIVIGVEKRFDNGSVRTDVERLLRERRSIASGQVDDFRMTDMKQISDTVTGTIRVMNGLVTAIASISLIVGGIGIVNIMLVSVTERTREIGVRMAIGAQARHVRLQFLTEAVTLCALGGLIGIMLAFLLSWIISRMLAVVFLFDPMVNLASLAFASVLGVLFGYVPAKRAAALNPIDALRHE